MTIRYATLDDKDMLIKLFNTVFGSEGELLAIEYIDCYLSDDYRKPYFVVKEFDGEIIGAAAYSQELFTTDTWGLSWVAVLEEHCNQGYGSDLVNFCIDEIYKKIENYAFIILGTFPNKTGLYDKNEFQHIFSDEAHGNLMIKKIEKD